MNRIRVIDSHTEGEPTRVIVEGGPDLVGDTLADCVTDFRSRFDHIRRGVVREPRGADVVVGALLLPPRHPHATVGVIFFNNEGYLGMCGHGTIGVVRTLHHLGRCTIGDSLVIDTPAGLVTAVLEDAHQVRVANVPSYVHAMDVAVTLHDGTTFIGDIAYGGNWFFLTPISGHIEFERRDELSRIASEIMGRLAADGITGADGHRIDHVELVAESPTADARNFVLCPGGAYDRSPCGTGTSAKMACLAARGKLLPGQVWRQESVLGSAFEGTFEWAGDGVILPTIRGRAFVTSESALLFEDADPFRYGIG